MCGLTGYIGNKPGNIDKLKIVALYNTTRGTDSCGIALNDQVVKGVGNTANFSNFIEEKTLDTDNEHDNYTVLIHTRNASTKSTKEDPECAHPFEIKNKKGKTLLIGMHNGVITNESEIAKKYGVKEEKVDSKTLLSILAKSKTDQKMLKVLEDYEGAAALMWYYPEEPNTLYVWKGASKSFANSTTVNEERPLFIYRVKDDEGKFTDQFYLSSIRESLLAIGGDLGFKKTDIDKEASIRSVDANCLIKIIPGQKFIVRPISRVKSSSSTEYTASSYSGGNYSHTPSKINTTITPTKLATKKELMLKAFLNYPISAVNCNPRLDSKGGIMLDNEPFLHDFHEKKNKVYFRCGRYWRNGHKIGGTTKDEAVSLELDIEGYPKGHPSFVAEEADTYYFFQGLLLQGSSDAEKVKELCRLGTAYKKDSKELNLLILDKHVWGFCQNEGDDYGNARDASGHWANGTYYPMFDYDRKYTFATGYFTGAEYTSITPADKLTLIKSFDEKPKEAKVITLPQSLKTVTHSASISEAMSAISDAEEDVVMNHCYEAISSIKAALKELDKVKDNKRFTTLYNVFKGTYSTLTAKMRVVENEKEENDEFTNEKGLLYS